MAARFFAVPSHYSCVRRAAAPSVFAFHSYVFVERFTPHLRRVATRSLCVARPVRLIKSCFLVTILHIILCRAVRRGLKRTPAPRTCFLTFFFVFLSVGLAASLPRLKSVRCCYSLLANTTRSATLRQHCVDSTPRLWEVESVAGTSWYSPRYPAAGHFTSY